MSVATADSSALMATLKDSARMVKQLVTTARAQHHQGLRTSRHVVPVIEARLRIEEQLLLPVFRALGLPTTAVESQLVMLRDLNAQATNGPLSHDYHEQLWTSIERMCTLHLDAIEALTVTALRSGELDAWNAPQERVHG
jgi:hypothetical protein